MSNAEKIADAAENTKDAVVEGAEKVKSSIVDTVFDIGLMWLNHGIKVGQMALEASAKTLQGTAKTLEHVSDELGKKA